MKVVLKAENELTDAVCKAATGQTLGYWVDAIEARPELKGKRRDAVNMWLYPEMGKDIWWATTAWVEYERKNQILQRDGRLEGYNICVTKKIAAPLAEVFGAWTSPGVATWFGDSPNLLPDSSIEDSAGNRANALRIRENKDLRYRWNGNAGDGTQVDVTFTDEGNGKIALMLLHTRIQTRDEADGLRLAWGEAFSRLKSALE